MSAANHGSASRRPPDKALGLTELVAIALGGMVGGGIFTILGISVALVGAYTPLVMVLGGAIASLAAYSYIKLGVYYRDEGATYGFFKRTFPGSDFAASLIGWWVIFGYISTLALYAYTFSSYALSGFPGAQGEWLRKLVAGAVILMFALINMWSVKGMGKIEDVMVYAKLVILAVISIVLIGNSQTSLPVLWDRAQDVSLLAVFIVASLTFVAYEGFQLVINAVNEMDAPEKNIPRAIYAAIGLAILIYFVISLAAILAIPFAAIVANKEYALAAGAAQVLGHWGADLVVLGALLATSSAISGTLFGASRQLSMIAGDGYFPALLARRSRRIPVYAIAGMSAVAFAMILAGNLQVIVEFGSVTFLLVSLLMAHANFTIRHRTGSSTSVTLLAIIGMLAATVSIFYYELAHEPEQIAFIVGIYVLLTASAWLYARGKARRSAA